MKIDLDTAIDSIPLEASMKLENRFSGKHVVITGAGQGIGKAAALRFAREGAEILLVARREEALEKTAAEIGNSGGTAFVQSGDIRKTEDVDKVIKKALHLWDRIDILINNAGVAEEKPFLEITEEGWDEVLDTNLKGAFLMAQAAAKAMAVSGGGVILHTASIDALGADGQYASYNASKAALLGLSRTMAVELAPYKIRVNCVSPGFTRTEMTELAVEPGMMDYLSGSFERVPLRRLVEAEEIAAAFAMLASDDASAITGTNLVVDGGLTANLYILETLRKPKPDADF
jgi:NAD(P)-dependent dehydrogenase (short-subunit alcohol dehydrogenase family)